MRGIEPLTFSLPRKRSTPELHRLIPTKVSFCFDASGRRGSNSRPTAWKAVALPTELLPRFRYKSVVGASGLEPLNPKERIYSPPQLPLCDAPILYFLLDLLFSTNQSTVTLVGFEPTRLWRHQFLRLTRAANFATEPLLRFLRITISRPHH